MNTPDIINWLRDQAIRAPEDVLKRGMNRAADKLEELTAELKAEMYRHDRLQDFEVAEAEELAKLKEQHRWIPVTERLPEPGTRIIVCRGDKVEQGIYLGVNGWWKVYGTNTKAVTHWMPLPDPPKEDI